jgi:hypothetical protein
MLPKALFGPETGVRADIVHVWSASSNDETRIRALPP